MDKMRITKSKRSATPIITASDSALPLSLLLAAHLCICLLILCVCMQGASLVEIYSSFALGGPYQLRLIKRELNELLKRDGYHNVQDAVGSEMRTTNK